MSFPAEAVPDGAVFAPHHAIYGLLAVLFVSAIVWDNYRQVEPATTAAAALSSLFGFLFVWPWYSSPGAALALGGNVAALAALTSPWSKWWSRYPDRQHAAAVAACLVALDDIVNHALGVPSPLDTSWRVLGVVPSTVAAIVAVVVAVYALDRETPTEVSNQQ